MIKQVTIPPLEWSRIEPPIPPPLHEVAERFGTGVKYQGHQGDAYGYSSAQRKEIVLESYDEQTFWHELAHIVHQHIKGQLKGGQDPKQEAVAELTATIIAGLYDLD